MTIETLEAISSAGKRTQNCAAAEVDTQHPDVEFSG
jgi:hypothetical protein